VASVARAIVPNAVTVTTGRSGSPATTRLRLRPAGARRRTRAPRSGGRAESRRSGWGDAARRVRRTPCARARGGL
jgi:hypothetical protein